MWEILPENKKLSSFENIKPTPRKLEWRLTTSLQAAAYLYLGSHRTPLCFQPLAP
jgi:hypothetical protein